MKKFLIVALIVLMIPATLFANHIFSIGATASTGSTINSVVEGGVENVKAEDFQYGAYANLKLLVFSVNATLFPTFDDGNVNFTGDLAAGLALDMIIVRAQLGLSVNYYGSTNFHDWDFALENEDIMNAPLNVRAEVDVLLGDLEVGIWGLLPTPATLSSFDQIISVQDTWQNASLGICVGVCL